ncbi:transposable element Tcb2 transposase [Trichonephila clavipes]|nr:transposable element Tcb2 transposase [Trichonephila clavipes]
MGRRSPLWRPVCYLHSLSSDNKQWPHGHVHWSLPSWLIIKIQGQSMGVVLFLDQLPTVSSVTILELVAPSLGTPVSSRTVRRHLDEEHLGSRCPLHELALTPIHRRLRLEWCPARGKWTAVEWNQVVFINESRFNLSSDENRVHLLRPRDEGLNPAFTL